MDGNGLISFLEGIRHDIPAPLQSEFDDVVKLVRDVVDALEQIVAPPDVIHGGKQRLQTHHTTLLDHTSTLKGNLANFQTVYTGPGSDAYHQIANQSLQHLDLLNDHLSFAINAHDSIAGSLGDAQLAQEALELILVAFIATTFLLPEGVPAYAAEGAGGGFSVAALWAAISGVGSTLLSLATAALPYIAVGTAAFAAVTLLSGDSPQVQQMAKGGKQNVIPTKVREDVNALIASGRATDPCDALGQLLDEAKRIMDKKERNKRLSDLDAARKGYKCKNKGKREENY